jgi:hypothetical protein
MGSMLLAGYGIAASAAHADPSSSAAVSGTAAISSTAADSVSSTQSEAQRLCAAPSGAKSNDARANDAGALARFETGTTFMLTENGLIVLKRPAPKKWYSAIKSDEPENLNTGG